MAYDGDECITFADAARCIYSFNETDENAAESFISLEKLAKFPDKCDVVIYRLQCVIYMLSIFVFNQQLLNSAVKMLTAD